MATNKIKFWHSLVSRFALFFAGLNILAILVVGYLVYRQAATVITSHSQERMQYTSNLAIKSFNSLLNEVANDIAVTTNNPVLGGFINQPEGANLEDLKSLFSVILNNKPNYFQIRLLDVNNRGKEVIRYDKIDGRIVQVPEDQLQFKGDRLYYQEALKISKGSYYYSDINLNEEFGKVSLPHTPTLRALGQIYDNTQTLKALLVINVDLTGFYEELKGIMESDYRLMMVNQAGDYLFAPDMNKCFGSQLSTGLSFTKDFGSPVVSLLGENEFGFIRDHRQNDYLYHLETLNYSSGQRIYLVNMLEDKLLFRSAYLVRNDSLRLVLLACVVSVIIAFLFARMLSNNINQITRAVSSYEEDTDHTRPTKLPESRKDELGLLARAFVRMRQRIDQQLTELKAALGREQQAIRERDQFLQNMSHELRTPLNAILGLTRLLNKNNPSRAQKPIIESLERSARSLSGLMHDVLDHQKLTEGKVHLNLVAANYSSLLTDIYAGYRYEAVNKGLSFELEIQDSLKKTSYLTDPLRFNQIVTNLVVNAIKFTEQGFVRLSTSTREAEMLQVKVSDSGRGIQSENLQKIRNRFFQEKADSPTGDEGYGLGLSIVKQLVDLFGGSLEVVSELNSGSTFIVNLPLIPGHTPEAKPVIHTSGIPLPSLKGHYSILHIEDDPSTLLMVTHALDIPNIVINQVTKIEESKDIADANSADLLLSDLMLNNQAIDSFLATFCKTTKIPLVILSAFDPERMKSITPFYLQKPFEISELMDLVVMLLGRNEYDIPQLEATYEQYDHQPDKIRNFLKILQQEFTDYLERFEKVFDSRDHTEWNGIMHKLTTHIRSLQLGRLNQALPEDPAELNDDKIDVIRNSLLYFQCAFRYESRLYTPVG